MRDVSTDPTRAIICFECGSIFRITPDQPIVKIADLASVEIRKAGTEQLSTG
jgi:hypothetical protein